VSWVPLREYLSEHVTAQIDDLILHDGDAEARALLAVHRQRIIGFVTDQLELITLRKLLAERDEAAERATRPRHVWPVSTAMPARVW